MNLQNSSIRTFTIMDAKNTLIYSTVSLSGQFSSNISILPCTISSLSASFHVSIQFWRTDERSCCFLRVPYSSESNENGQQYTQYPIWVLCTGESQMSEGELKNRTIIYFRITQALLQPHEFRPPWSYSIYPLSVPPDWLCSILCTAEKMINENPQLLSLVCQQHCTHINDPSNEVDDNTRMERLLSSKNSPGQLIYKYLKSQANEIHDQNIYDIMMQGLQVVFIDDKILGVFSGSQYEESSDSCTPIQIDGIDAIILSVLQKNKEFTAEQNDNSDQTTSGTNRGQQEQQNSKQEDETNSLSQKQSDKLYQHQDHPNSILDKLKQMSLNEHPEDNVVECTTIRPPPLARVLQLRIDNQITSCVVVFKLFQQQFKEAHDQENDFTKASPRITTAYIFKIDSKLHKILVGQCQNDLEMLINICTNWVDETLSKALFDFRYNIVNQTSLLQKQPEIMFSLQNIINLYPGIIYFHTQNITREITIIPNIDEQFKCKQSIEYQRRSQFVQETKLNSYTKKNVPLPYNEPIMLENVNVGTPIFYGEKQDVQAKDIIKFISKQPHLLKQQQMKLQELQYESLKTGLTYVIESDNDVTRLFCIFYYFCGPQSDLHGTVTSRTGALSQQMRHMFSKDQRVYPVPISRQHIMELNQNESIASKKRMTYPTNAGGWINTSQYWKSFDQACKADVLFKKEQQHQYELFAIQAAFLSQVDVDDVPYIANDLFQHICKNIWMD